MIADSSVVTNHYSYDSPGYSFKEVLAPTYECPFSLSFNGTHQAVSSVLTCQVCGALVLRESVNLHTQYHWPWVRNYSLELKALATLKARAGRAFPFRVVTSLSAGVRVTRSVGLVKRAVMNVSTALTAQKRKH